MRAVCRTRLEALLAGCASSSSHALAGARQSQGAAPRRSLAPRLLGAARCFQTTPLRQQEPSPAVAPAARGPLSTLTPSDSLQLDDLIVTVKAAARINAVHAKYVAEGKLPPSAPFHLRVKIEGGGCSGFKYEFVFDPAPPGSDDLLFHRDGACVVTDAVSLDLVRGATLDWDDSMMRSAFAMTNNPNAESSCGCKSSFAPKAKD